MILLRNMKRFIYMYIIVYFVFTWFWNKPVYVTAHAIERAELRGIAYPDTVRVCIHQGKAKKFGRRMVRFIKRGKNGSIICIGEDVGHAIIIKTIERGN